MRGFLAGRVLGIFQLCLSEGLLRKGAPELLCEDTDMLNGKARRARESDPIQRPCQTPGKLRPSECKEPM